ncbi:hypothetical protein HELRODRAFT_187855 [Helobdella robusta]|uniref:C-terminal of Roc (COR) domain-containing protein n=1 Tax=Helobdella robusta TaxID=6412 RepID=T1FPF6_HELRO|nr:hypothetical protein HELRODRAFT_187855 [Helobdella robusta]ESO12392.1 hypothetical protein HELRODRAFT_187855 [Helobdella robusta]
MVDERNVIYVFSLSVAFTYPQRMFNCFIALKVHPFHTPFHLALKTLNSDVIQVLLDSSSFDIYKFNAAQKETKLPSNLWYLDIPFSDVQCQDHHNKSNSKKKLDNNDSIEDKRESSLTRSTWSPGFGKNKFKCFLSIQQGVEKMMDCLKASTICNIKDFIVLHSVGLTFPIEKVFSQIELKFLSNLYIIGLSCKVDESELNNVLQMLSLQTLALCEIQLTSFPAGILNMSSCLRVLKLCRNCISQLPESIGELIHLRILCLDFQKPKLKVLPNSISNLTELQVLSLRGNEIQHISWIRNFLYLQDLRLDRNELLSISEIVYANFGRLNVLDISYNFIETIPYTASDLIKRLRHFEYYCSTLRPLNIRNDVKSLIHHLDLHSILTSSTSNNLNEGRDIVIAVVGESNSGKKSLIAALSDEKGICRQDLKFRNEDGGNVQHLKSESFNIRDDSNMSHHITMLLIDSDYINTCIKDFEFDAICLTFDLTIFEPQNVSQQIFFMRHIIGIQIWLETLYELFPNTPVILIGTKAELIKPISFSASLKAIEELIDKFRQCHKQNYSSETCSTCFLCSTRAILSRCLKVKSLSKFGVSCVDFSLSSTYGSHGLVDQTISTTDSILMNPQNCCLSDIPNSEMHTCFPHIIGYYECDSRKCFPKENKKTNSGIDCLRKAFIRHFASDNCLYSLKNSTNVLPMNWISFVKHLNRLSCTNNPPIVLYDEIVSICRSFDIVFWQIPLLLRYCQSRCHLTILKESENHDAQYVITQPNWLVKLENCVLNSLDNPLIYKSNLKNLISKSITKICCDTKKVLEHINVARFIRSIMHYFCLTNTCLDIKTEIFLFPKLLRSGDPSSNIWNDKPSLDEKQITCEVNLASSKNDTFINLVKSLLSAKGIDQLGVLVHPIPVVLQQQIIFYVKSDVESCSDCYNFKYLNVKKSCNPTRGENMLDSCNVYHKLKINISDDQKRIRICVRGSQPCCTMKLTLEYIYLHAGGKNMDMTTKPNIKQTAKNLSYNTDFFNFSSSDVIERKKLCNFENQHYIFCPKCIFFKKSNPQPIYFKGVLLKRKPVCDYWHHLGSWSRAMTGSYKSFSNPCYVENIFSNVYPPDNEFPRLVLILPSSSQICKKEWQTQSKTRFMEGFEVHFLCENPTYWHLAKVTGYRILNSTRKKNEEHVFCLLNMAMTLIQIVQCCNEFNGFAKMLLPIAQIFMNLAEYKNVFDNNIEIEDNTDSKAYNCYLWLLKNKDQLSSLMTKFLMTIGDGVTDFYCKINVPLDIDNLFQVPTFGSRSKLADFFQMDYTSGNFADLIPVYLGRELRWVCSDHYNDLRSFTSLINK